MLGLHRIGIVMATAGLAAGLALLLSNTWSETFYVTIPVVALAVFASGIDDFRQAFRTKIRPGIVGVSGWFVFALGAAYLFLGPRAVLSWRFWIEVATCLYYLGAVIIVLLTARRLLLMGMRVLHERWQFSPGVRMVFCEVLPLAIFVILALPFGIAFAHVHRFKMPNLVDPQQFHGRAYEEIEFASGDGTPLRGWWIPAKSPSSRTLIICHGIAANRSIFLPFVEVGDWLDANVLMFDLRGHGDSGGRTITLGYREKDDILAALAYARCERPEQAKTVIGMGISLGAASLAEAAALADPPFDAVILDSCFTSTSEMTHSVLNVFPGCTHPWLLTLGLPMADWHAGCPMMEVCPEASIRKLRTPVLFLHSRGDPLIPSEHATRLYQRAQEPKRLCVFELPGHCDAFFAQRDRYREEIIALAGSMKK